MDLIKNYFYLDSDRTFHIGFGDDDPAGGRHSGDDRLSFKKRGLNNPCNLIRMFVKDQKSHTSKT